MPIAGFIFFGVLILITLYVILIYNRLVQLKHDTVKAWANIDVLLAQRHDELPKLVETCKQYMKHEKETLERVIQARGGVSAARKHHDVRALGAAEGELRQGLMSLFAVAENYPELKADQSFRMLERRITELESSIADRREFYNDHVNANNVRLDQFPDLVIARLFGFKPFDLLEFSDTDTSNPDLRALFG
ncbi:LemA family protein [Methylococcus capsulatus]|uniref:LemA family protein n=1 Tax=Methylococcus capsulatus TaxID=414 RepID=UPI0002E87EBB|nr:LemA family protein [Methylococcus capsulatus]